MAAIATIPAGFPLYVVSGTDDPIHMGLAWLDKVVARYREAGLDVTARYYDGGRHEVFNETNRDEVLADLVAWLDGLPVLRRPLARHAAGSRITGTRRRRRPPSPGPDRSASSAVAQPSRT